MENVVVKIDFERMMIAFRNHVRSKAIAADNTIYYLKEGLLIEENPKNSEKIIRSKGISMV